MSDITKKGLKEFLRKVKYIWDKNEEIIKLKHERFNIFSILRKEHEEEKLHSAFLAQLLNPKGDHGFGDTFLKIFVKTIIKNNFLTENVYTYCEKVVENGRVDIYIDNGSQLLLIENKIYAGDQDKQLERYHSHMSQKYENADSSLLYLTLDGKSPTNKSKGNLNENQFQCISYKDNILPWLELCLKESTEVPTVRETIKQYINLIKKLTGGLNSQMQQKEIIDLIKNNLDIARLIRNNFEVAERELQEEKITKIIEDIPSLNFESKIWNGKALLVKSENELVLAIGLQPDVHVLVAFPDYNIPKNYPIYGYDMTETLKNRINNFGNKSGKGWSGRATNFSNVEEFEKIIVEWDSDWKATNMIKA